MKGNPGKTNKLGSFKQANDCLKLFVHNSICLVTSSILFMDGLTEISDGFCQIIFPALVLLHCFKTWAEICLISWGIPGIRIPKVMTAKVMPCVLPLFLVLLTNMESKMLREFSLSCFQCHPHMQIHLITSVLLLAVNKLLICKTSQSPSPFLKLFFSAAKSYFLYSLY